MGVAGWVVGKSDFNENPVVSLDLDFDLGFVNKFCFGNINVTCFFETFTGVALWLPYLLFVFDMSIFGPLLHFLGPSGLLFLALWGYFWGQGQVQKHFWDLLT